MSTHVHETAWYSYTSSTQTMRSWARVLESYKEVPELFLQDFPPYTGEFPYTVLIPEDKLSLWSKRNEKMLVLLDDRVILLEAFKKRIHRRSCPFKDVLSLEYGKILLYSWLTIATPDDSLHVKFNTSNSHCFEPIMKRVRQGSHDAGPGDGPNGHEQEQFSNFLSLMKVNYKYMNYGRQSIRSGDRVLKFAYQAERCLRRLIFLKKVLFSQYASNHLSILTDKELILIREDPRRKNTKKNLYGAVFSYIPLQKIRGVSLSPVSENAHKTLQITLSGGLRQTLEFADDNSEIDDFYQAVQNILGGDRWKDFRVSPL